MMTRSAILALTTAGIQLAKVLRESWNPKVPIFVSEDRVEKGLLPFPTGQFKTGIQTLFKQYDALICIMATGIVVRSIAEVLEDKRKDPAVIVIDEKGRHTISLLSGHVGGGNQLTLDIAATLRSCPVITTATDVQNVTAIDVLSKELNGWYADVKATTKRVNRLLAEHRKVGLIQRKAWVKDLRGLTVLQENESCEGYDAILLVSDKREERLSEKAVQIVPRRYVLGIGAKKGIACSIIKEEYLQFCQSAGIHQRSIKKIVSIDLKKEETGIRQFAEWLEVPFKTYSAAELAVVSEKYPQSAFVKAVTGVGSVSLAAADLASKGQVVTERYANHGVTFALGKDEEGRCCTL